MSRHEHHWVLYRDGWRQCTSCQRLGVLAFDKVIPLRTYLRGTYRVDLAREGVYHVVNGMLKHRGLPWLFAVCPSYEEAERQATAWNRDQDAPDLVVAPGINEYGGDLGRMAQNHAHWQRRGEKHGHSPAST